MNNDTDLQLSGLVFVLNISRSTPTIRINVISDRNFDFVGVTGIICRNIYVGIMGIIYYYPLF